MFSIDKNANQYGVYAQLMENKKKGEMLSYFEISFLERSETRNPEYKKMYEEDSCAFELFDKLRNVR